MKHHHIIGITALFLWWSNLIQGFAFAPHRRGGGIHVLNGINRLFMAQQDDDQSTVKVVMVEEEEDDQSTVKVVVIEEKEEEDEPSGVTDKQFKQWEKDNDPEQYWQVTSLSAFVWFRLFVLITYKLTVDACDVFYFTGSIPRFIPSETRGSLELFTLL